MGDLTGQEKELLKRILINGEHATAFTTDSYKIAVGLVNKEMLKQHRNLSPWHDTFKFTREGRKVAKAP